MVDYLFFLVSVFTLLTYCNEMHFKRLFRVKFTIHKHLILISLKYFWAIIMCKSFPWLYYYFWHNLCNIFFSLLLYKTKNLGFLITKVRPNPITYQSLNYDFIWNNIYSNNINTSQMVLTAIEVLKLGKTLQ